MFGFLRLDLFCASVAIISHGKSFLSAASVFCRACRCSQVSEMLGSLHLDLFFLSVAIAMVNLFFPRFCFSRV